MKAAARNALRKVCEDLRKATAAEGVLGVVPDHVAAPASVEEAAAVMRTAAEHGLSVVPRGGETRLDWGLPPASCDLLLDTVKLDQVVEHAAGDLIVKVQAGLTMERLGEVLEAEGQQLALDIPLPGSTVGGTLATGACGPRRLRYGSPRDLLIGVTIIRADGTVAKSGGKVVKNVAGYDLGKLLTGSYGTLGLIVEAAFRLHPIPPALTYLTRQLDRDQLPELPALLRGLRGSTAVPTAIEVDAPAEGPLTVAVLADGVPEAIGPRAAALADLLGSDTKTAEEPPDWWGMYPDGTTLIETSRPGGSLPPGAAARWSADGHGFVALSGGPDEVAAVLARLREGAGAVVRYAPQEVREGVDMWGPIPALGLMRRVKDQFDPAHRLSPGRFAGGI